MRGFLHTPPLVWGGGKTPPFMQHVARLCAFWIVSRAITACYPTHDFLRHFALLVIHYEYYAIWPRHDWCGPPWAVHLARLLNIKPRYSLTVILLSNPR